LCICSFDTTGSFSKYFSHFIFEQTIQFFNISFLKKSLNLVFWTIQEDKISSVCSIISFSDKSFIFSHSQEDKFSFKISLKLVLLKISGCFVNNFATGKSHFSSASIALVFLLLLYGL